MSGPPILADDFGIPTFHAVVRASNHLKKRQMQDKVSLIISGGLMTPGEYLKVLALGADAVYLGTVLLFTVTHKQIFDALPFEPPTQIVFNEGENSDTFDINVGADAVTNLLNASTKEIKQGLRAMGKTSLNQLSRKDLVSYDESTATQIGIPFTLKAWEESKQAAPKEETAKKAVPKQQVDKSHDKNSEKQSKKITIRPRKVYKKERG